jgi:hypothetical protein
MVHIQLTLKISGGQLYVGSGGIFGTARCILMLDGSVSYSPYLVI